jgi:hypothetical protein
MSKIEKLEYCSRYSDDCSTSGNDLVMLAVWYHVSWCS